MNVKTKNILEEFIKNIELIREGELNQYNITALIIWVSILSTMIYGVIYYSSDDNIRDTKEERKFSSIQEKTIQQQIDENRTLIILRISENEEIKFSKLYDVLLSNNYLPSNEVVLKDNYYIQFMVKNNTKDKKSTDTYTKMVEKVKNQQMYNVRAKKIKAQGDIILNKELIDTRKPE